MIDTHSPVRWLCLLILIFAASSVRAQATGEDLSIALVTMGPGEAYWERYGHNAILVENTKTRAAALYNYGVFDFQQDSFLINFLRGQMQYQLMPFDPQQDFRRYIAADRDVRIQYLALTAAQRLELAQFLAWNARPENAPYRYDYFRNNCSTRIRDALDEALDGALLASTASIPSRASYRFHADRQSAPIGPLYLGVRLALGRSADRTVSRWDELFMPAELHDAVAAMTVTGPDGDPKPLVQRTWHLHESDRHEGPPEPPYQPVLMLAFGVITAVSLVWLLSGPAGSFRHRLGSFAGHIWIGAVGLSGVFLGWLALGSDHYAAHYNENILVLCPLLLLLWIRRAVTWVAVGLALAFAGALVLKLLPGSQQNLGVLLAVLPLNLVVVWHRWRINNPSFGT